MPRVLPMGVVECAVGMSLVMKRSNPGSFEPRAQAELPSEGRLDIQRERACSGGVRRQHRVNMVVGRAESQQPSPLALRENDTCEQPPRGRSRRDRSIVLESKNHVKTKRSDAWRAIPIGTMKMMVARGIMARTIDNRGIAHLQTFGDTVGRPHPHVARFSMERP